MKGCLSVKILSMVFLLVFFAGFGGAVPPQTEAQVEITAPERDGMKVGVEMDVKGTADIPAGTYLWVLVHRIKAFKKVWWPQEETEIDPVTKRWEVFVAFGGPQDVGFEFEIAAIVVNEMEHLKLKAYRAESRRKDDFKPIPMPPTVAAPVIRKVIKVSGN